MDPGGQFHQAHRTVSAGNDKAAGAELDVSHGGLQHVRGDLPAGLDNLVGGADDRVAAVNHRFGPSGAAARDQFVAVALNEADALEWDAKPRRQHLGEWRPVPLPVIQGAGDDRHSAVRLEADAAHLAAGRPGQFEIIADAAPAQFAAGSALLFSLGKPVPVGQGHCLVQ